MRLGRGYAWVMSFGTLALACQDSTAVSAAHDSGAADSGTHQSENQPGQNGGSGGSKAMSALYADAGSTPVDMAARDAGGAGTAGDASPPAAGTRSVTIRFKAKVFNRDFSCRERYAGVGSTHVSVEPVDFRFFVQDLKLVDGQGHEVPVALSVRSPWQTEAVALLDFEDQTGSCGQGNALTNDQIVGTVPMGVYKGVVFTNGVPEQLNHEDPLLHPPPLQATDLTWGWLAGFKFFVAELHEVAGDADAGGASPLGVGLLHVGSRACSGDPKQGTTCVRPDRNQIRLDGFDPDKNVIVADIGAVFAETDLTQDAQCHSQGDFCAPMFKRVGIDWTSGQSTQATQQVYRVE